jgi:hypothetical protein
LATKFSKSNPFFPTPWALVTPWHVMGKGVIFKILVQQEFVSSLPTKHGEAAADKTSFSNCTVINTGSFEMCATLLLLSSRQRAAAKAKGEVTKKTRPRDRSHRTGPVPEANAELQANLDVSRSYL